MKFGNKIKEIVSINSESFIIKLRFSNKSGGGTVGEVDLSSIFTKPKNLALEIMKGAMFSKCYIESTDNTSFLAYYAALPCS